ncbi:MAG: DEAD/DEAH box helicase family protein [Prevotella sp.]|nr:DEAD/DEAH box helicase family protein [Prevotella sp.]
MIHKELLVATFADRELSEEDIKSRFIQPALEDKGWDRQHMRLEYAYTAGRVIVQGSLKLRKKGKRCDYILYTEDNYPIAVVEAKDRKHEPEDGLQQAIDYATDLQLPFAYSSNGAKFVERDIYNGTERILEMDAFPTPAELKERERANKQLTEEGENLIDIPYYSDSDTWPPRYYQRLAINKTIEAIAQGRKRILLVMATGTGKTYTAFQIIHRFLKWKPNSRILYLADRNILIDQTMQKDFRPFKKIMTKVQGKSAEGGKQLYMSLYGQWVDTQKIAEESEEEGNEEKKSTKHPYEEYARNFFDMIVVDECHRSSINEDKQWHKILEYFDQAIQIGMTATPKSVDGADNLDYFTDEGYEKKPVYEYKLIEGIRDGYLAPYRVTKSFINKDLDGYVAEPDEVDKDGNTLDKSIYVRTDFGRSLQIEGRQRIVAHRITQMMKKIGRMTKTIVFCPDQEEALLMRQLLIELNADMVKKNPNYIVRITSDDRVGKKLLDDFIDPYTNYPVIATTSELLTTGVDCKTCGLIVIDKEVSNPTTFKQMIGRGTRIFEKKGKLSFDILDFRNATSLFEKDFDGDIIAVDYGTDNDGEGQEGNEGEDENKIEPPVPPTIRKYHVEGEESKIVHEVVQYLDENGRTMRTEKLTDFTRQAIKKQFPTLDAFRGAWRDAAKKQDIIEELKEHEVLLDAIREENPNLRECDAFDIICHVAFDATPLTRQDRINNVKKRDYLHKYEGVAREVLEKLMEKYGEVGIVNIEDTKILNLDPFTQIAKRPRILKQIFHGVEDYEKKVHELINELYKEA